MKHILAIIAVFLVISAIAASNAPAFAIEKARVVGWVEPVRVKDVDVTLSTKLDTGAKTSSLNAKVLGYKDNPSPAKGYTDQTVIFSVMDGASKEARIFERDVVRFVNIKLKEKAKEFIRRPVVVMTFCIADREVTEEVNLADRSHFKYPVLVGRNMLAKTKLHIDAGKTNLTQPQCKPRKKE